MWRLIILFTITQTVLSFEVSYDNYKVYKVYINDEETKKNFFAIEDQIPQLDRWGEEPQTKSVDVMVGPDNESTFTNLLYKHNINYETVVDDVGSLIRETSVNINSRSVDDFNWTAYHNFNVIYSWLDSLAEAYPNIVTTFVAGYSYHGNEIKGVRIQLNPNATRVAVLESGIHAREWIAPATSTYIINALLTSTNTRFIAAAQEMIWYILPTVNPDGYNHSMIIDRMHRKNLQVNSSFDCTGYTQGVDLNRNFEFMWMANGGASDWPCSQSYAGPYPFSAPESQVIRSFVDEISENLEIYLTIHSFSQLLLVPYGHTADPLDNYYEQYAIGRMAADAIYAYNGSMYTVGNSAEAIYISTGCSDDWVKAKYQPRLVFCYELRDTGRYGFLLPPDQIVNTAEETIASLIVLVEQLIRFDSWSSTQSTSSGFLASSPYIFGLLLPLFISQFIN